MHVRAHPNGRVIVTPVDFSSLAVDADDEQTAMRAAIARVTDTLRKLSGSVRARFADPVVAELDSCTVEAFGQNGTPPVRITVALVVAVRETHEGTFYVVAAPEVDHAYIASTSREAARKQAQKAILEAFPHWGPNAVLSCDDVGESRLELVEVPFPPPAEKIGRAHV